MAGELEHAGSKSAAAARNGTRTAKRVTIGVTRAEAASLLAAGHDPLGRRQVSLESGPSSPVQGVSAIGTSKEPLH